MQKQAKQSCTIDANDSAIAHAIAKPIATVSQETPSDSSTNDSNDSAAAKPIASVSKAKLVCHASPSQTSAFAIATKKKGLSASEKTNVASTNTATNATQQTPAIAFQKSCKATENSSY